ncbi:MAG: hypothetical protein ACR2NP_10575, partial [Pirellulaceae bacterium]
MGMIRYRAFTPAGCILLAMLVGCHATVVAQVDDPHDMQPPTVITPYFGPVAGHVLDEDGLPIADVTILCTGIPEPGMSGPGTQITTTTTGLNGRFALPYLPGMAARRPVIAAVHPDYAAAVHDSSKAVAPLNDLTFTLNQGITLRGQLLNRQGQGAAGVGVGIREFWSGEELGYSHSRAITDEQGSFEIHHLPDLPRLYFHVQKEGVVDQTLLWLSPEIEADLRRHGILNSRRHVYGEAFTWSLPGKFNVAIEPVHAETGEVLPLIRPQYKRQPQGSVLDVNAWRGRVNGDAQDAITFSDIESGAYRFLCAPNQQLGMLGGFFHAEFNYKSSDQVRQIRLIPGIAVTGTVKDAATGEPIAGAQVCFRPADSETFESLGILPQQKATTTRDG